MSAMALVRSRSESALLETAPSGAFTRRERAAIAFLVSARRRLLVRISEAGVCRVDTQSEKGAEACGRFLSALEETCRILQLAPCPRDYREGFSTNYKGLFEAETRSYRVDILEAGTSLQQHPVIWANGEEYELSAHAMRRSEALKEAWTTLLSVLDTWSDHMGKASELSTRSQLVKVLNDVDGTWAHFECAYISELMKVQERARRLVEQAVDCERCLAELERRHPREVLLDMPSYQVEKRALVACIARLNSVANVQRKGRDDLTVGILDSAVELLEQCEEEKRRRAGQKSASACLGAARDIAEQVVEAFEEFRDYLQDIQHHLDLLHPQLCQNVSLVARLVRWEEAWEIGARYVHNEDVLGSICYLVGQLKRAGHVAPKLAEMFHTFDAELFLVLPRIVWLCFLAEPGRAVELICRLLPHRFETRAVPAGGAHRLARSSSNPDLTSLACELSRVEQVLMTRSELHELIEQFWRAEVCVSRGSAPDGPSPQDVLIQRAVAGSGAEAFHAYSDLPVGRQKCDAVAAAEDLMHDLEGWSMELQRHSPEDWNECVNVLVRCVCASSSD
mmetsp:Transcript_31281/g.89331  ORF Transcript_31281/g.89331 Transcript_31281/m.89331 type:complete len:565 (-) Transcript_31281:37-1731(-)